MLPCVFCDWLLLHLALVSLASYSPCPPLCLHVPLCRQEKDTAVILGKEQERLREEAEMAAAAAERMEQVLAAVGRAQAEPLR